jgi:hypothetical protein
MTPSRAGRPGRAQLGRDDATVLVRKR